MTGMNKWYKWLASANGILIGWPEWINDIND
jgi:hypothetical protein